MLDWEKSLKPCAECDSASVEFTVVESREDKSVALECRDCFHKLLFPFGTSFDKLVNEWNGYYELKRFFNQANHNS